MAIVHIEIDEPSTVRDLTRYLELLQLIGIDPDSSHPVHINGTRRSITSQIGSDSLLLPTDLDDESDD